MINTNKFDYEHEDCDILVLGRTLDFDYTRLTKSRYKRMMRWLRTENKACEYRYGGSNNGYPYRCGCEHDCCGCISTSGWRVYYLPSVRQIKLVYFETYNL